MAGPHHVPDNINGRVLSGYSNVHLVDLLRVEQFDGEISKLATVELVTRSLRAVRKMISDGTLNKQLATILPSGSFRISVSELDLSREWVTEAVAEGINKFRQDTLAGCGWNPEGCPGKPSADLPTWVINGVILRIPGILHKQRTHRRHVGIEFPSSPQDIQGIADAPHRICPGNDNDPVIKVLEREGVDRLKKEAGEMGEEVSAVIALQVEEGLSRAEACKRLGFSQRAIEGRILRWRKNRCGGEQSS